MAKMPQQEKVIDGFTNEQGCSHEWAEAFCIAEDFNSIEPNGEECIICGEKRGNTI
jgi:hypothetical protein